MKIINFLKNRTVIQSIAALSTNANIGGFLKGEIWRGNSKYVCTPGLNCYSCPGAVGSCPVGALQSVLGGVKHNFSYYVVGTLLLFGVIFGRFICGFLCPFGFVQDLLYKIKTPKFELPEKIDKVLRWFKYVVLIVFVIMLPIVITNAFGMGFPYFCKLICPAGTLGGGIPLILTNSSLRNSLGFLFGWKMFILIFTIGFSIFTYRPFCKYICPLGAIYSLFNRFSFYQMNIDKLKCTGCKKCEKNCKMNVKVVENINSLECIRCGECKKVCPHGAIESGFKTRKKCQK